MKHFSSTTITLPALLALTPAALSQFVLHEIEGGGVGVSLKRVAACGDVDQDGTPDLLVGTTFGEAGLGLARLISGRTGAILHEYQGEESGDSFGSMLAGVGDFDGDGVPDFAVSSPNDNGPFFDTGRVHVYSGATYEEITSVYGTSEDYRLGRAIAGVGDVNADGYDDLLAAGSFTPSSPASIYLGPDGTLLRTHYGPLTRPSVAGVGDVDQDGHADYIIGWPQDSTMGTWTGRATVFSGKDGSEIHTVFGENPAGSKPNFMGDHLGRSVSGAGDVDGDGIPDFIAGAPGEITPSIGYGPGFVRVYSGLDATIISHLEYDIEGKWNNFGDGVSGGQDVNGDGIPDVLVGAPNEGPARRGAVCIFSGATGEQLWKIYGSKFSAGIGYFTSTALVPDLNGDGLAEFAIGDPEIRKTGLYAGRVTVYAGAPGDAERYCPATPSSLGTPASIELRGPISAGNNLLRLRGEGLVPSELSLFFYGPGSAEIPFGDGVRCVAGPLFRLTPPEPAMPDGTTERPFDFTEPPAAAGAGAITAGSTWCFQLWYRDPASAGAGVNLSDALQILFTP